MAEHLTPPVEAPVRVYERPRRSLRVEVMMWVANRMGARAAWPDYDGKGIELSRGEYNYDNRGFWDAFGGTVTEADLRGKDLLDIGCGWGGKAVWYAEHAGVRRVAGFDVPGAFDPEVACAFAREHEVEGICEFTTAYAESVPYPDSRFDIAMMDDVLEHVADPERVLSECARVLRPGGTLIVRFPSIRMIRAHHFDRAITFPGMHYLAGMETWAAGLNYYREHNSAGVSYTPFLTVKRSAFGSAVTSDLSGLDWRSFTSLIDGTGFETRYLEMAGLPPRRRESTSAQVRWIYEALRSLPWLRERVSSSIAFVGVALPESRGPAAAGQKTLRGAV
jgi:2-polyprenyl-3-methyl-5-hydroxy-6-metoxy-1,4-benzoquinol methylase